CPAVRTHASRRSHCPWSEYFAAKRWTNGFWRRGEPPAFQRRAILPPRAVLPQPSLFSMPRVSLPRSSRPWLPSHFGRCTASPQLRSDTVFLSQRIGCGKAYPTGIVARIVKILHFYLFFSVYEVLNYFKHKSLQTIVLAAAIG